MEAQYGSVVAAAQLDEHIVALEEEIGLLRRAREALVRPIPTQEEPEDAPRLASVPRPAGAGQDLGDVGAASTSPPAEAVLAVLQDGVDSSRAVAERLEISQDAARERLRELELAGLAKRSGERRDTRWHPVAA